MMSPEAALPPLRFAHDAATSLLWGTFAYLAILVPRGLGGAVADRVEGFRRLCIVVAVASVATALPLETAAIGEGWWDAADPTVLRAVLFETAAGSAWLVEAAAAALLAACLLMPRRRRAGATAAAAGLLLACRALSGHAVMHEGALGVALRINVAVHVLAGGAWLGALVPLVPILRTLHDPECRREASFALRRFSAVGHGVVALAIGTGIVNTLLILGRWPTDVSSPYTALLDVKLVLVGAMTALALLNRYRLVPRLGTDGGGTLARLRANTITAVALGLSAVVAVAVFGLLDPR